MNVLFISNLFPNAKQPTRGMFNAQQVAALSRHCNVRVIAPTEFEIAEERHEGIAVVHPRFLHIPILTRPWNGQLFARAIRPRVVGEKFDVVMVNWAYPDAYGVKLVADELGFPFATTVQGSDLNVLSRHAGQKRKILEALRASSTVFTRSNALRDRLAEDGINAQTVYNGVDQVLFQPRSREAACRQLDLPAERRRILFVGNLVPVKGPTILVSAFRLLDDLSDVDLVMIGAGPESAKIPAHDRILMRGARPHAEIATWMNACDVLCLPSLNEGMPNVVLESLASGLPVVATRVGGVPEVICDSENGVMVNSNNISELVAALRKVLTMEWDTNKIRHSVNKFDWQVNAQTVLRSLENALAQ